MTVVIWFHDKYCFLSKFLITWKKWLFSIFNSHLKLITALLISNVSCGQMGGTFMLLPTHPLLCWDYTCFTLCQWTQFLHGSLFLQICNKIQRIWRTPTYSSIFLLTEQLRPSLEIVGGLAFWAAGAGLGFQSNSQLHSVR